MPHVNRLRVFPIKSLDGRELSAAQLVGPGSLRGDREYAITDEDGEPVTGKQDARVHRIRTTFAPTRGEVTVEELGASTGPETFSLDGERGALNAWFSDALDRPVSLVRNTGGGFPDDTVAHGPTLISTGTIRRVAEWMDLTTHSVRRRFRANVEIAGVPPFWEDGLYGAGDAGATLDVGGTTLEVAGPSRRCVVPTRDPDTGEQMADFRERFVAHRRVSRPSWANRERLGGHFRLALNTAVPDQPSPSIKVGDSVTVEKA